MYYYNLTNTTPCSVSLNYISNIVSTANIECILTRKPAVATQKLDSNKTYLNIECVKLRQKLNIPYTIQTQTRIQIQNFYKAKIY